MATEVIVGVLGFGTAVIGLVTAYVTRNRHVTHRHELVTELPPPPVAEPLVEVTKPAAEAARDEGEIGVCATTTDETNNGPATSNKYGRAALRAIEIYRAAPTTVTPPEAWELATTELFGAGTPAQKKDARRERSSGCAKRGTLPAFRKANTRDPRRIVNTLWMRLNYSQQNHNSLTTGRNFGGAFSTAPTSNTTRKCKS